MNKKRLITNISVLLAAFTLGFFIVKGRIAINMQGRVIQNTQFTSSPEIIKREIKNLDKAIKLSPRKYLLYATRAHLNCRLHNYKEAINDYNTILKFRPDDAECYMFQGMIYDWIKKPDSALVCYQKSEQLFNAKILKESDKDNIASHKINLISLKILQNDSISAGDLELEPDVEELWKPILMEISSKNRDELLNEMFDE